MNDILESIRIHFNSLPAQDERTLISPLNFVAALIFSLPADLGKRSLASLRRGVIGLTGASISRGTFWERVATKRLQQMLMFLACSLMSCLGARLAIGRDILGDLGITALYILDSTSVTLPKNAHDKFPAPRSNVVPAAIKWHALFDFFSGSVAWFDLSAATVNDRKGFPPLEILPKGALIIFDLGYWDFQLLKDLIERGIYFLSRVKSNSVIKIEIVVSGIGQKFEGRELMRCRFPAQAGLIVELVGSFQKAGKEVFRARVIGFWNPVEKGYHWYVTSLPLPAELMYPLYRLRWQCELAFKACKSVFNFSEIDTSNTQIIYNLVLIGIIHCLLSIVMGNSMANKLTLEKQLARSIQRSAIVFFHLAQTIFEYVTEKSGLPMVKRKIKLFVEELCDPNYQRRKTSLAAIYAML
jgi:hypothetical protein